MTALALGVDLGGTNARAPVAITIARVVSVRVAALPSAPLPTWTVQGDVNRALPRTHSTPSAV